MSFLQSAQQYKVIIISQSKYFYDIFLWSAQQYKVINISQSKYFYDIFLWSAQQYKVINLNQPKYFYDVFFYLKNSFKKEVYKNGRESLLWDSHGVRQVGHCYTTYALLMLSNVFTAFSFLNKVQCNDRRNFCRSSQIKFNLSCIKRFLQLCFEKRCIRSLPK